MAPAADLVDFGLEPSVVEHNLAVDPEEDPGWKLSPRLLLFLVPGYLRLATQSADQRDGLELARQVWTSFTGSEVLFGIVLVFIATKPAGGVTGWALALVAVTIAAHAAETWTLSRPLKCDDLGVLAASYRTRFFLAVAFAQCVALSAFVGAIVSGRWWLYWLFLPLGLYGLVRAAPTQTHIASEQERLKDRGCDLSLVRALRTLKS